jgi:type I restriction enzyme S subunit
MKYPRVPLGRALRHRSEFFMIDDDSTYKRCRVQLHAQGVVLRDMVKGAELKTKKQQICRAGEFLVAEIDAKVGGFGIIPVELSNAIVSSHYFLFEIDNRILDRDFLGWFIRTQEFRQQVTAQGSTNYAAIRPNHVLEYLIPLPSIEEQHRIAAKIQAIAATISQARSLRVDAQKEIAALCVSLFKTGEAVFTPMNELVGLREPDILVDRTATYNFAGVYSFGRGVFKGNVKAGTTFAYDRLTRIRSGEFLYPKLMAWEGALGIVPPECNGLVVSPEFPVFTINTERVLPETLDVYFRSPAVWPTLAAISTGTNVRRRRLHPSAFLRYEIPLPSMEIQKKLREARRAADEIEHLHNACKPELDALLPSILNKSFLGEL